MTEQKRTRKPPLVTPTPSDLPAFQALWDDDPPGLADSLQLEDEFNRPTRIPTLPPEAYAVPFDEQERPTVLTGATLPPDALRPAATTTPPGATGATFHPSGAPQTAGRALGNAAAAESLRVRATLAPLPGTEPERPRPATLDLDFTELRSNSASALELADDQVGPLSRAPDPVGPGRDSVRPRVGSRDALFADARDRHAMGDFTGALVMVESILEKDPTDQEAARYAQSCRDVLVEMYTARLGSLQQVPSVGVPPEQIRWLSLDHKAGFLLSLVDARSTIEEILDICGMNKLDALRIMHTLREQQIIRLAALNR